MTKRIISLVAESFIVLMLLTLLAISITGGFRVVIGSVKIASMHNFRNPVMILCAAFVLRWWAAGHPLRHWRIGASVRHLFQANGVNALAVKLFLFLLLNGVLLNAVLSGFQHGTLEDGLPIVRDINTGWFCTQFALLTPVHERLDSWYYLYAAAEYLRDPGENTLYSELYFQRLMKFQYPPMSVLLVEPFLFLAQDQFIRLANFFSWLSIFLFSVVLARIFLQLFQRHAPTPQTIWQQCAYYILAYGFTLTFYPFVWSFRLGQIQTWLALFFVLALWAWMSGKTGLAGICIGLICIIKPQLGLLAVWGGLRKQWRFTSGILVTIGGFSLISLYRYGWANHLEYLEFLSYMSKFGESYYANQSVNGLLHRLFFNGPNILPDIGGYPPYNAFVHIATLGTSGLLIAGALFWKCHHHRHAELLDLSLAALSFTMASPIAWIHHYNIMLPMFAIALAVVATTPYTKNTAAWSLLTVSFMLCSNLYFVTNYLAATRGNVLQSLCFFGALLFLALLYSLRSRQHRTMVTEQSVSDDL